MYVYVVPYLRHLHRPLSSRSLFSHTFQLDCLHNQQPGKWRGADGRLKRREMASENTKETLDQGLRETSDGSADLVRRQTVGREQKHAK